METAQDLKKALRLAEIKGYIRALQDYGIWKSGVQHIGCLETPVKEIIDKILRDQRISDEEREEVL